MNCLLVVVAEVTQPSLGVGYELGRAKAMNKKILCLFRPKSGKSKFFCSCVCENTAYTIRIQIVSDRNQLYKFSILQLNDGGLGPQKYVYSK